MMNHRRRMLMNMASALPPKDTLQNTSWENIAKVAAAGKAAEYWAVGNTKTITFGSAVLGSTTITVKIMGFEYDDLASGGKAPITFGTADCFATAQKLNNTATNAGGWGGCVLRATLINAVLPALQAVMGADIIKPVSKRTSAGSKSTTINTTEDSVWLYSDYEVYGVATWSVAGEKPTDKSICYPGFTNNSSRVKKVGTSNAAWWHRSPSANGTSQFCNTGTSGATEYADNALNTKGAAIGFCV